MQGHKHNQYFGTLSTASDVLWRKEIHSNILKERVQNKRQNLSKPEQSVKTIFSEALTLHKSKNFSLTKVAYIYEDHAQKLQNFLDFSVIYKAPNGG